MPLHNPLWEVLEPLLVKTGLYTVPDPTYGRWLLPPHPPHVALLENPAVRHRFRRIFLAPYSTFDTLQEAYDTTAITFAEDVTFTADEIQSGKQRGGRWVAYSMWEMDEPEGGWEAGGRGVGRDLVLIHGLSDYGMRYAPHALHFLKAGFRLIMPDLPSYGRSSGVNSYLPSLLLLPAALHAVLTDVVQDDLAQGRKQRKVFLSGASMGGWTVLYYLLKYPPTTSAIDVAESALTMDKPPLANGTGKGYDDTERPQEDEKPRPHIAGAFVLCPMVEASKSSRPPKIAEWIAKGIVYFAGQLPLVSGVRGKVSDDPAVEEDFFSDPLCYHGKLRVGTGLSLLEGMNELQKRAEEINVPIRLVHGSKDRATSHLGTLKLFDRLPNEDKEIEIYDGYEHIMIKPGRDEQDDRARQRVLADWREWLLRRC
ncbi:acylglycerol lipase, partial [Tremellales sp. Uapishka_1]